MELVLGRTGCEATAHLAPGTPKDRVSLPCNFEIELSDQTAVAGKGQRRKPPRVE